MQQAHIDHLPDGPTLVYAPFPKVKSVTLHAWVLTGSAHETPALSGISHFVEHMLFRGNQVLGRANELSLKMEELGGEINAATSLDHTEFWLEFHRDYLEEGIRRFCRFLLYPQFNEIEIEKKIILEEIKSSYNDENQIIDLDSLTAAHLWPNQAIGLPIHGLPETVMAMEVQQLQAWYERHYCQGNLIVGLSGDFNPKAVRSWFSEELKPLPPGPKNPPPQPKTAPQGQVHYHPDRDNQYQFQWSFILPPLSKKERAAVQLLTRMLDDGSSTRLQRLIREEKGLVYEISANPFFYDQGGLIQIQGQVSQEKMKELITTLAEVIRDLKKTGFHPKELRLARLRLQTSLDCYTDNAEGILIEKVTPLLNPTSLEVDQLQEIVKQISLEDINQLLDRLLGPGSLFVALGPPAKDLKSFTQNKLAPWL